LYRSTGTKPRFPRDLFGWDLARGSATPGKIKFQSENIMAGLYLGVAVAGVNALVATGLVIAFM
jgi:hypothetical protein